MSACLFSLSRTLAELANVNAFTAATVHTRSCNSDTSDTYMSLQQTDVSAWLLSPSRTVTDLPNVNTLTAARVHICFPTDWWRDLACVHSVQHRR